MQRFSFCFSLINEPSTVFRLKESQPCYDQTSGSAVLSISGFIVQHLPKLRPPTLPSEALNSVKVDEPSSNWQTGYYPLEEPWSNYIIDLTINHHAQCHLNTFYIDIPIVERPENHILHQYFTNITITEGNITNEEKLQRVFGLPKAEKSGKRIGIISYRSVIKTPLEPRVNSVGLFIGNLFRNDDWKVFRVEDNQIPSVETLIGFDCVILPGSVYSVCGTLPDYINKTIENIFLAMNASSRLKVIGACFGHQAIAKHFGAKVEKLGRVGGIQKISFDANFISKHEFSKSLSSHPQLYLSKHHQDFVTTIPEGFKPIATSDSCKYEAFLSNDHRILTVQFHSEYYNHFTKRYEHRRLKFCGKNELQHFYVPESEAIQKINTQHSRIFLDVMRRFIM